MKRYDNKSLTTKRWFMPDTLPIYVIAILLALVPPIALVLDDPFLIRLFTRIVIFATAAVSLNFVLGFGGFASLLHAAFMGLGGYVVGILAYHEANEPFRLGLINISGTSDLSVSMPIAIIVCGSVAAITGLICLRSSGIYFIMITLAFNQMFFYFFVSLPYYGGEDGLQITTKPHFAGVQIPNGAPYYYTCLVVLLVALVILRRIIGSRFGVVLRAISQNERRIVTLGIPALPYKVSAFVISGAMAGIAGVLLAGSQSFVSPADLSWIRSADLIVIAVLGGVSLVWGPVIGAVGFFVAELLLSSWSIHWQLPFGILIIIIGVFMKGGMADPVSHFLVRTRGREPDA
jgi:branched-chain amino acid transport system permease protein